MISSARNLLVAALATTAAIATPAAATTIAFDDGTCGTAVGSKYAAQGITFSNASFTNNFGLIGSSGSLGIFSSTQGYAFGSDNPLVASFASAMGNVSIRAIDVGAAGASLFAYNAAGLLIGSDTFTGSGLGVGAYHDLKVSAADIRSIRIFQAGTTGGSNRMGDGILFDNLSFSAAVPEPATWGMMLLGFGATAMVMRRRRSPAVTYA